MAVGRDFLLLIVAVGVSTFLYFLSPHPLQKKKKNLKKKKKNKETIFLFGFQILFAAHLHMFYWYILKMLVPMVYYPTVMMFANIKKGRNFWGWGSEWRDLPMLFPPCSPAVIYFIAAVLLSIVIYSGVLLSIDCSKLFQVILFWQLGCWGPFRIKFFFFFWLHCEA